MFTPLDENGKRLRFKDDQVRWVSGYPRRGPGLMGYVEISGRRYEVHGHPCAMTREDGGGCYCDAQIKPMPSEKTP